MKRISCAIAVLSFSIIGFAVAEPVQVNIPKVPSIPGATVLCVNGGDTSGTHDNTWQKLNTESGAPLTWKKVGGCIAAPPVPVVPPPAPLPAPVPVPSPPPPPPPPGPVVTCMPDAWTQKDQCPSGVGTIDTTTTVTCPAGPLGAAQVASSSVSNCAAPPVPLPLPPPPPTCADPFSYNGSGCVMADSSFDGCATGAHIYDGNYYQGLNVIETDWFPWVILVDETRADGLYYFARYRERCTWFIQY